MAVDPRESARKIASISEHVNINKIAAKELAEQLITINHSTGMEIGSFGVHPLYPKATDKDVVEWIFVIAVMNFNFWNEGEKCVIGYQGIDYTGQMAMMAAVARAIESGVKILDSSFYANIGESEFKEIMKPDSGADLPLLHERYRVLKEAGRVLNEKYGGTFVNCIKKANHKAKSLLDIVVKSFPSFRDEVEYGGQRVGFYKRAQFLISEVWCCYHGKGLGSFEDMHNLTMFADYRIPQVLVHYGVLNYSDKLRGLLEKSHIFEYGDSMEIEIRGCSVHAIDIIYEEMKKTDITGHQRAKLPDQFNVIHIDKYLWHFRRNNTTELKSVPYHKVRSIYY